MGDVLKRARNDFTEYEEDAMAEILARLPVKDLIRFRCVCKSWRALISSSYFVKKHLSYSQSYKLNFMLNPPLFLDLDSMKNIEVGEGARAQSAVTQMEFPATETFFSFYRAIVGSCNGLMCVQVDNFEAVMIWNPCTREFKVLPNPPPVIKSNDRHCFYGFGYDSASDDYKVIRGFTSYRNPAEAITIDIFALKTGSWMTVKCHNYVRMRMWQGLFLNGALHWLCDLSEVGNLILAFDLGSEKFHEIPLPFDSLFCDPLIHKNCLCVVACPTGTDTFDVWIMKEYGVKESWTEDLQVSMESYYQNDDGDDRGFFKPVCILENGVIMIDWMGLCDHLSVYSIPKDRTMKRVVELMADLEFRTVVYQETLVSPNVHTCKTQSAS